MAPASSSRSDTREDATSTALHAVLLQALALEVDSLPESTAKLLLSAIAPYIESRAQQRISQCVQADTLSPTISPTDAALLAVVHRYVTSLAIDVHFVHNLVLAYVVTALEEAPPIPQSDSSRQTTLSQRCSLLASRIVESVFSRRPSLVRAIESILLPGYFHAVQTTTESIEGALSTITALMILGRIPRIQEAMSVSSKAASLWTALQHLYDQKLPNILLASDEQDYVSNSSTIDFSQLSIHSPFIRAATIKLAILDLVKVAAPNLHADTLLAMIEAEADAPDPPSAPDFFAATPPTLLLNTSMLCDAQLVIGLSDLLERSQTIRGDERVYIQKTLGTLTETIAADETPDDSLLRSMQARAGRKVDKGKGKGKSKGRLDGAGNGSSGHGVSTESTLLEQVGAILPDVSPEVIVRLSQRPDMASLSAEHKVERIVQAILEGETSNSTSQSDMRDQHGGEKSTGSEEVQQESSGRGEPGRSAFAARRRNLFDDRMDLSKARFGKQDILNDPFLPSDLKDAIMNASATQAQEEEEEDQDESSDENPYASLSQGSTSRKSRRGVHLEDDDGLVDSDLDATIQDPTRVVRVKDDVDEESDAEEETGRMQSRSNNHASTGSVSSASSNLRSGFTSDAEKALLRAYAADASVFSAAARKSSARTTLKKELASVVPSISDEQLEGWARMLERNPRKDRLLEKANEFTGNQKGLGVRHGKAGAASKNHGQQRQQATKTTQVSRSAQSHTETKKGPPSNFNPTKTTTASDADADRKAGAGASSANEQSSASSAAAAKRASAEDGDAEDGDGSAKEGGSSRSESGRGGRGPPGRGRGTNRGRGHQSDQRRRGHDKKMARAGV